MHAAWDWDMPRETEGEQQALIDRVLDIGFDTLIVNNPAPSLADMATAQDVTLIDVVTARPTDAFLTDHADCIQVLSPTDHRIHDALLADADQYRRHAHWKYPLILSYDLVCYAHEASLEYLESRIEHALSRADGVAFDGIGFRNQYGCHCAACHARRDRNTGNAPLLEVSASVAERQLIETSERLYTYANAIDNDAIVMNHVWPPFNPNPRYAHQLRLDYCSQTIAWFHRPHWELERVRFEAQRHRSLAGETNTFVPFIGMADTDISRRSPDRLRSELEIANEYGAGNFVFSTLAVPARHRSHANVFRNHSN